MPRRLLEPELELELVDEEHVLVRVHASHNRATRDRTPELELVLEDAALRALSMRRVSLRYEEAWRWRNPGTELPA